MDRPRPGPSSGPLIMAGHTKTLNPKQARFAEIVALGVNGQPVSAAQAARLAGYGKSSQRGPADLTRRPIVQAEIERIRTQARATLIMDAQTWQQELLKQYNACDNEGDRANALAALDKWAKRLNLYEQHESSSRATEVLSALAGIGQRMIASRQGEKAPVTVEARISGLLHQDDKDARAPSRTRVLTEGETGDQGGTLLPSGLSSSDTDTRGASQL